MHPSFPSRIRKVFQRVALGCAFVCIGTLTQSCIAIRAVDVASLNQASKTKTPSINLLAGLLSGEGFADGKGTEARLKRPSGLVMVNNVLYIADGGSMIRTVAADGTVTTVAGTSGQTKANFDFGLKATFGIYGMTAIGNIIYFTDPTNCMIDKFDTVTTAVTFLAGKGCGADADGVGQGAKFDFPRGITTDTKDLYVTETRGEIRKVTIDGAATKFAGKDGTQGAVDNANPLVATFASSIGITYVNANGTGYLLIADMTSNRIREINLTTKGVTTLLGNISKPVGLGTDGTFIYASTMSNIIVKIALSGGASTIAGTGTTGIKDATGTSAQFNSPMALVSNGSGFYIADSSNNLIRSMDNNLAVTTLAGYGSISGYQEGTGTAARFNYVTAFASDGTNIYSAEYQDSIIRKITPDGVTSLVAGQPNVTGYVEGNALTTAEFNTIQGMVYINGTLYVSDSGNYAIRAISNGSVYTFAGGTQGDLDGNGSGAQFSQPYAMTSIGTDIYMFDFTAAGAKVKKIDTLTGDVHTIFTDLTGTVQVSAIVSVGNNLFVTDPANLIVYRLDLLGNISTFAGQAGMNGFIDGIGAASTFQSPNSITSDGKLLYVLDNSTVRTIDPTTANVVTLAGVGGQNQDQDGAIAGTALIDGNYTYSIAYTPFGIAIGTQYGIRLMDLGN